MKNQTKNQKPDIYAAKSLYIKNLDLRVDNLKCAQIKPGDNVRVNVNIRRSMRPVNPEFCEVSISLDVQAVQKDEQIFEMNVIQAGLFEFDIEKSKEKSQLKHAEKACSQQLIFPLKNLVIDLSKKSGFHYQLFEMIDFNKILNAQESQFVEAPKVEVSETIH